MNEPTKDRLDDLASLFLPDILHSVPGGNIQSDTPGSISSVKQEDFDYNYLQPERTNTSTPPNSTHSFNNFISNNNFINIEQDQIRQRRPQQQIHQVYPQSQNPTSSQNHLNLQGHQSIPNNQSFLRHQNIQNHQTLQGHQLQGHQTLQNHQNLNSLQNLQQTISELTNLHNYYDQSSIPHQYQHMSLYQLNNGYNQLYDGQSPQPSYPYQSMHTSNSATNFLNNPSVSLSKPPTADMNWFPNNTNLDSLISGTATPVAPYRKDWTPEIPQDTTIPKPKKKLKPRVKDLKNDFTIDYKPAKLKRLLDFKKVSETSSDYTIIDKDNNEIKINFNGFLNGRFLTNDTDNNNYMFTKNELQNDFNKPTNTNKKSDSRDTNTPTSNTKKDPKVISCYRRNYIQISLNICIDGFKTNNKLLRLQSNEYGYTITRVIKYFKIEITASTNISNNLKVPIFIKNMNKNKTKMKEEDKNSLDYKDDLIKPSFINTNEHIIILNDEFEIENGQIDKFFIIKKLQFKNATPNNGNLTFQNYYHLTIKLTAIVADLYYDDYVDDELNNGLNGNGNSDNNEIVLYEIASEPIIVRGRNPNFYTDRKDILIKGRSATSKKSFKNAGDEEDDEKNKLNDNFVIGDDDVGDEDDEDEENSGANSGNKNDDDDISHDSSSTDEEYQTQGHRLHMSQEMKQGRENHSQDPEQAPNNQKQIQHLQNNQLKDVPPLAYSSNLSNLDLKDVDRYKYFPISNVYYLPPINVVYFPHRAHQQQDSLKDKPEPQFEPLLEKRKSSNVYFK